MVENDFQQAMKDMIEEKGSEFSAKVVDDMVCCLKFSLAVAIGMNPDRDAAMEAVKRFLILFGKDEESVEHIISQIRRTLGDAGICSKFVKIVKEPSSMIH